MIRRIRRSAAAALRISLISGCAALGWLALSAGAATADDGGERNLLGSVTSVVGSVSTPVESVVQDVTAPLKPTVEVVAPASPKAVENDPAVSDPVSNVPAVVDNLSVSKTVAPVTDGVDSAVSQVPIVNDVLPSGTATITEPVLETVDSAVAPVLSPVQQVVTPVVEVLDPIVEAVAPVVEVVDPIVKPVVDPVVDVVNPVVDPAPPVVELPDPVDPGDVGEPALPDAGPVAPTDPTLSSDAGDLGAGITETAGGTQDEVVAAVRAQGSEQSSADGRNQRTSGASAGPVRLAEAFSATTMATSSLSQSAHPLGALYMVQEGPQLALADAQPTVDPAGSPATGSGTGSVSSGSSSSGSAGAADAPSIFDRQSSSTISARSGYFATLPQGPTYDPGSTPD